MKYFRLSFLFVSVAFLISSCQKELSFEAGLGKGTLKKDISGECLPVDVKGSYKKDTALKPTVNLVDIQINVADVGSYSIKTDTVNGYSFSAAGVFSAKGLNTVRLIGSGKPLTASVDVFTVKFDTSVCQFSVIVTGTGGGGGGTTSAVFTLVGSPTNCTGAAQSNNYFVSMPTTASNYVDVKVDVTTAGTYTITAPTVNGVSFLSTGNLSVGTNQTIRLVANGTPTLAGTFQYALNTTAPVSNCGFSLIVQAAPTPATYTFDCSMPQFFGTYQSGASTAGDSVIIKVTSIAGGSYSISSNTANNVSFSGSGVLLASPTPQNVTLLASAGPATASGPFTYTISGTGGTGVCSITQTYGGAPVIALDSIVANVDGVYTTFKIRDSAQLDNTSLPGYAAVIIFGESNAAGDQEMGLAVAKMGVSITPGIYNVNQFPAAFVGASYSNPTTEYTAQSDINFPPATQIPGFTITISTITATKVVGTFSGRVFDNQGAGPGFKNISNGIFSVTVYP